MQQKAVLHNRFDFEIYDIETGETEYAQAENIVLNKMWERLCGGLTYFNYIGIGTGSGALSPTRTTLFSHLAYKSAVTVETVYDTDTTAHVTKRITFSETEAIGTWTEVGILYATTVASNYVTHALITDSEGNPITIDKTNTKIITVYATVFATALAPPADHTINRNIFNSLLNSPADSATFDFSSLVKADGSISKLGTFFNLSASFSFDIPNKRRRSNLARLSTTQGNAPIRCIGWTGGGSVVIPSAVFPQKDFTGVAIGTGDGAKTEFDFPLPFIKSTSETIYVNGSPKTRGTDYTVRYGLRKADTTFIDITYPSDVALLGANSEIEEVIVLPQPSGDEAEINSVVIKNSGNSSHRMISYDVRLSLDGVTWVLAGSSGSFSTGAIVTLNSFPPAKYKFMKMKFLSNTGTNCRLDYIRVFAAQPSTGQIVFTNPPASGHPITSDFAVEYIPKSSNFVLDVQAEIVFGEGA